MKSLRAQLLRFFWITLLTYAPAPTMGETGRVSLTVLDVSGAPVAGARILVRSAQQVPLKELSTDASGVVHVDGLAHGVYAAEVEAQGFEAHRVKVRVPEAGTSSSHVTLSPGMVRTEVTVTANRGVIEELAETTYMVGIADRDDFYGQPLPTLGNALQGSPGVFVQQSTYGQVSPFLRGLTGHHVLNLIDGVRFNNSTFRSGPNQYLAFVEPSQVMRIETVLGPVASQYGSDSLGGVINMLTPEPRFGGSGLDAHGELSIAGASADRSGLAG